MRGLILVFASWLCALAVQAQGAPVDERQALACLVKGAPALQFGDMDLQPNALGLPTYVRLRLLFERADRSPTVEVLASTASSELRAAVLTHVTGYRLPCLGTRPVAAVQEFQFAPDLLAQGGPLLVVRGPATPDRACLVTPRRVDYAADFGGKGLLAVTFGGEDDSPTAVNVLGATNAELKMALRKSGWQWRLPCRRGSDWPLVVESFHEMRVSGERESVRFAKKRLPFQELLGFMKGTRDGRVFIDLDTMQCPFRLSWMLRNPWAVNQVREVGEANPNRAALTEWLTQLQFDAPRQAVEQLVGEDLEIEVPCGKLNLTPEKR